MGDTRGPRRKGVLAKPADSSVEDPASYSPTSQPTEIPDKLVFRIGEVSRIVGVEPYVLRYWESEFPQLSPKKSGTGHRMYRRREVEQLLLIRQLLYDRQYTIKGARQYLKELSQRKPGSVAEPSGVESPVVSMPVAAGSAWQPREPVRAAAAAAGASVVTIDGLRQELRSILALLE
jgi:DNA-binding transcriptional MerR regulator